MRILRTYSLDAKVVEAVTARAKLDKVPISRLVEEAVSRHLATTSLASLDK